MKNIPADVLALLATRQFYLVDLYTFTFVDGHVERWCFGDKNIVVGAYTFNCGGIGGPHFVREGNNSTVTWETGLQVSTLEFTVYPGSGTVNGIDFSTAVTVGYFDYAECLVERAIMPTGGYGDTSAGTFVIFSGLVGDVQGGRGSGERFTINSWVDLLNINMPRNLFQPNCVNTLYDSACTLDKASFQIDGTVLSGSTIGTIKATLSQATGYFDLGSVTFLTGANAGQVRGVQSFTNGSPSEFTLIPQVLNTPVAGDTFRLLPGCDKMQQTCAGKFDNFANFRGFPSVPAPETAA